MGGASTTRASSESYQTPSAVVTSSGVTQHSFVINADITRGYAYHWNAAGSRVIDQFDSAYVSEGGLSGCATLSNCAYMWPYGSGGAPTTISPWSTTGGDVSSTLTDLACGTTYTFGFQLSYDTPWDYTPIIGPSTSGDFNGTLEFPGTAVTTLACTAPLVSMYSAIPTATSASSNY